MEGSGRMLPFAMQAANETLQEVMLIMIVNVLCCVEVFGLKALEAKKGTQIIYILINCLSSETKDKLIER